MSEGFSDDEVARYWNDNAGDDPLGIRYTRASFSDLAMFADASFDAWSRSWR